MISADFARWINPKSEILTANTCSHRHGLSLQKKRAGTRRPRAKSRSRKADLVRKTGASQQNSGKKSRACARCHHLTELKIVLLPVRYVHVGLRPSKKRLRVLYLYVRHNPSKKYKNCSREPSACVHVHCKKTAPLATCHMWHATPYAVPWCMQGFNNYIKLYNGKTA